jgi:hypothetical protein
LHFLDNDLHFLESAPVALVWFVLWDAAKAAAALLEAVAVGDLTPAEASELGKLIEAYIKALEATDFAERLDKLERMTNR